MMSDINDLPADWAIERALKESGYAPSEAIKRFQASNTGIIAFARYIETKEEPPVTPWLLQARVLAAGVSEALFDLSTADRYRKGVRDNEPEVQAIATALLAAFEQGKAA